jgi:hypothetical protein
MFQIISVFIADLRWMLNWNIRGRRESKAKQHYRSHYVSFKISSIQKNNLKDYEQKYFHIYLRNHKLVRRRVNYYRNYFFFWLIIMVCLGKKKVQTIFYVHILTSCIDMTDGLVTFCSAIYLVKKYKVYCGLYCG